ncbi:MAG: hypothetical protein HQ483_09565 [Rhodospirillales bacterium]|nr:hypothetical protein [Rhodospirillales bacterium]
MVSEYLNHTRSILELDRLFEKDRKAAGAIAEIVFSQDISAAILTVSDITEVTNSRILADTQVASAKIAASAEVHATALLASAQTMRLKIQNQEWSDPTRREIDSSIVTELARRTEMEIKSSSRTAIDQINAGARAAIVQITENAKKSVEDIESITGVISDEIKENARIALAKLQDAQQSSRTPEAIAGAAEKAATEITDHATSASLSLTEFVKETVAGMTKSADAAILLISETVSRASERIVAARDKALEHVKDTLATRQ